MAHTQVPLTYGTVRGRWTGEMAEPLSRAERLLEAFGLSTTEELPSNEVPMELLMEVMEVRSALEECQTQGEVEQLLRENEAKVDASVQALSDTIGSSASTPCQRDEASRVVVRLRYYTRIREEAVERLSTF